MSLRSELLAPVLRWTPQRKLALARAITQGDLQRDEVISAHDLTDEELNSWLGRYRAFGLRGLCVRKLQRVGRAA